LRLSRLFVFLVVVPTALAVLYFGVLAHDVYVSESQFVVRTVQRSMASGLGSLLQSTGLTQGSEDVYSVENFLISRDALQSLEQRHHLKRSFGSHKIDLLARFDPLGWDGSFEALLRYFQRFVARPDLDSTSSILTLTVRAFSAREAYAINEDLLRMSEDFVNRLNERARRDLVRFATADVDSAEQQQRAAVLALSKYRNAQSLYDPDKQSDLQIQEVGALQAELVATRKFFFSSRRLHTSSYGDWSSDVCSSDLPLPLPPRAAVDRPEGGCEFIVMAANLLYIKSRSLLPVDQQPPEEEAEEDDPRWELIRQLIDRKSVV